MKKSWFRYLFRCFFKELLTDINIIKYLFLIIKQKLLELNFMSIIGF